MYEHILVPVDGSATACRGLDEAIKLARLTGACIRVVHILDELVFTTGFETGETYLKDVLPKLKADGEAILSRAKARVAAAGVPVQAVLLECFASRTADLVVEQVQEWKADLVVIGTHGRRGVRRLMLGSDAEEIVRRSPVPVLVVRDPAAASATEPRDAPATQTSALPA